jgi:O-antigen/teichoic acid export membrane protein
MYAVGYFSFASSVAVLPNLISTAVDLALAPIYFQRRDASDGLEFAAKLKSFFRVYLAGMLPLWAIAVLFAPEAIRLVAGEKYLPAAPVLAILLCASYARMQLPFLLRQLHFLRKTWIMPVLTIPSTAVSLGLILVFASKYGIVAAAFVTLATDLAMLISAAWTVRRYERIDYPLATALFFTTALTALAVWSGFETPWLVEARGVLLKFGIAGGIAAACLAFWIWPKRRLVMQLTRG